MENLELEAPVEMCKVDFQTSERAEPKIAASLAASARTSAADEASMQVHCFLLFSIVFHCFLFKLKKSR